FALNLQSNTRRMYKVLTKTPGYAGIAINTDSILAAQADPAGKIFQMIFARGVGTFEMNPEAPSTIPGVATANNGRYIKGTGIFSEPSWDTLEKAARDHGAATGVIVPSPQMLESLKSWLETLPEKGFELAPVSAIPSPPAP
ncbi:MAG: divergent polysaccharide deacetylase family protein, partial [Alphaproteobacteria bacterium]|nr:divergent polysaccharide deacetylase family protein [Alphaproteobacteria bacterium]